MADVIKTIKPGGGGDYTSLSAWEAAISADPTDNQIAECYNGACGGVTLNVSNANAVTFTIRPASGSCYRDGAGWPSSPVNAQTQKSYLSGTIAAETGPLLVLDMPFVDGLSGAESHGGTLTINRCLQWCQTQPHNGARTLGGQINLYNSFILHNCPIKVGSGSPAASKVTVINCSLYKDAGGDAPITNEEGTDRVTVKNSFVTKGNTTSVWAGGGGGGAYNGISASAANAGNFPATNLTTDLVATDLFVDPGGNYDLHLKSGIYGDYIGTDESATIGTDDIDGQTRTQYDYGADSPTAAPSARNMTLLGVG